MGRRPLSEPREQITSLRLSKIERSEMQARCEQLGFKSISDYLRHLHKAAAHSDLRGVSQVDINGYGEIVQAH